MGFDVIIVSGIVGVLITIVLLTGSVYGSRHLRDPQEACPPIGKLYIMISGRRITRFIYRVVALEAPFLCILIAGYLLAPSDLMDFLFLSPSSFDSFMLFVFMVFTNAVCLTISDETPIDDEEPMDEDG